MNKPPLRILLVDDEVDFVEMLALRLEESGEIVMSAHSGEACLDILSREPVDVVLLDIRMPDMDGIETLRRIKTRNFPVEVLLLTGHGTMDTAVQAMDLGAFDYLLKPADFKEITAKIERFRRARE